MVTQFAIFILPTFVSSMLTVNFSHAVDHVELAKKAHEFATSQPLATLKNAICFNDQQKGGDKPEGKVLPFNRMLCHTVQQMVTAFDSMGMEHTNDSQFPQTDMEQKQLLDGVEELRKAVKNLLTRLHENVVNSSMMRSKNMQKKVETQHELKELENQLMSNLEQIKTLVKRGNFTFLNSMNLYTSNCLTILEAMDAFLTAHPGFGPEEKMPWAMAEFGVILWVMAALESHSELGHIAHEADEWIVFQEPKMKRN